MIHDINLHIENVNSYLSYKDYNNINDKPPTLAKNITMDG